MVIPKLEKEDALAKMDREGLLEYIDSLHTIIEDQCDEMSDKIVEINQLNSEIYSLRHQIVPRNIITLFDGIFVPLNEEFFIVNQNGDILLRLYGSDLMELSQHASRL